MMQQPLTAKVLIKLKPYATLKFWRIRACNVLKMRVDWGVIISSSLMLKAVQTIGDDDEEFLKMRAARFWKNLKERTGLGNIENRLWYRCHRDMCFPGMRVSHTHIPRDACFPAHISLGMRVSHQGYVFPWFIIISIDVKVNEEWTKIAITNYIG